MGRYTLLLVVKRSLTKGRINVSIPVRTNAQILPELAKLDDSLKRLISALDNWVFELNAITGCLRE